MSAAATNDAPGDVQGRTGKFVLFKASTLGRDDNQQSNVESEDSSYEKLFGQKGALEPPYDPVRLAELFEMSSALRQNVDAYCTNIDGFGHRFEPVIDLDAADADDRVSQSIMLERQHLREMPGTAAALMSLALGPRQEEVDARKALLRERMRAEKMVLEQFFKFCSEDMSFVSLRRKVRQDLETSGNAYVEVLRNGVGRIGEFVYLPGATVRLIALDSEMTPVSSNRKVSDTEYETRVKSKRLRRLVQVIEGRAVFFKEFGDPRIISKKTGATMGKVDPEGKPASPDDIEWAPHDGPATEVIHFRVHSSRSAYGVPRWIGAMLCVLGNRQAEEVNYYYFQNKSVPPLAILVSGGRLGDAAVKRIEDHIENEIKGKKNFHKILLIEAESSGAGGSLTGGDSGAVKVEIKPLTDAQQKDALFMNYDERNTDKVGQAFRLPRMLRGDIRDFNRATAEAALDFAEQQVFSPEREEFDFVMNRKVFSDLRVRFWDFKSNAPSLKDPAQLAEVINKMVLSNVLTPFEARELAEGVFNKDLRRIDAPWTKQPLPLTLAGVAPVDEATGQALSTGLEAEVGDDADEADAEKAAPPTQLVTRTAMGYVTTVNEARLSHGLEPMLTKDGAPDPRGDLTLAEFLERAKERQASPAAEGADAVLSGKASTPGGGGGDLNLGDLQRDGGLLSLAQGAQLRRAGGGRRKRPKAGAALADQAKALLSLRVALREAEARTAADAFFRGKMREMSDNDMRVPDEIVRALVPVELLKADHERDVDAAE